MISVSQFISSFRRLEITLASRLPSRTFFELHNLLPALPPMSSSFTPLSSTYKTNRLEMQSTTLHVGEGYKHQQTDIISLWPVSALYTMQGNKCFGRRRLKASLPSTPRALFFEIYGHPLNGTMTATADYQSCGKIVVHKLVEPSESAVYYSSTLSSQNAVTSYS